MYEYAYALIRTNIMLVKVADLKLLANDPITQVIT